MSKNIVDKMISKGYSVGESENLVKDVIDCMRELIEDQQKLSLMNLGTLEPYIKTKPAHLMTTGSYSKTFKVRFTQSRSLQKKFKLENYGGQQVRSQIRKLLKNS